MHNRVDKYRWLFTVDGHFFGLRCNPHGYLMVIPKFYHYRVVVNNRINEFETFKEAAKYLIDNTVGNFYRSAEQQMPTK